MRALRLALVSTFLLTLLLGAAPPASAQGVGVGIEGLITNSSLRGGTSSDAWDSRTGQGIGLWVGGNRFGTVGFQGEFIYLVKKFRHSNGSEAEIQALEIPAVFHINAGRGDRDVFGYGIVGPVFTINVKEKLTGGLTGDNFADADIGLMVGAGVEFFHVAIEGRGNWGLRNISDEGLTTDKKTFSFELVGKFRFN